MAADHESDDVDRETESAAVAREWHVWLAAMIVVGGAALILVPDYLVPELVRGLGPLLVLAGLVGWVAQWAYRRWR